MLIILLWLGLTSLISLTPARNAEGSFPYQIHYTDKDTNVQEKETQQTFVKTEFFDGHA